MIGRNLANKASHYACFFAGFLFYCRPKREKEVKGVKDELYRFKIQIVSRTEFSNNIFHDYISRTLRHGD